MAKLTATLTFSLKCNLNITADTAYKDHLQTVKYTSTQYQLKFSLFTFFFFTTELTYLSAFMDSGK